MIEICSAVSLDKAHWNRIVLNSANGRLCHLYEWSEILPRVYNYKPVYLTIRKNDEIIGVFPSFLIKSRLFGNRLVSMPFTSYGGPVFSEYTEGTNEKLLSTVVSIAKSSNLEYVEIRSPSDQYRKEIEKSNFIENTNYNYCTFLVDLKQDSRDILMSLRKSTRRGIMIAEKRGVSIEECQKESDLYIFYDLYLATMRKHGTPPHRFEFFKEVWNYFYPDNLKIFFAIFKDKIISAMLFYILNKRIHYAYGASVGEKKYLRLCPNNLIIWHAIKFGKARNLSFLDLGRT